MLKIWGSDNIISWIFYPLSILYGGLSKLNIFIRSKKAYKSKAFVISVGNINVGGTGKTPLTIAIANFLSEKGKRVAVVGHSYKAKLEMSEQVDSSFSVEDIGDEAYQMSLLLNKDIMLFVGKNRVDSLKLAEEKGAEVIILDDAFSATFINRDFDIVTVDGKFQLGNKKVLPSGGLREPISGLKRADALVVINRSKNLNFDFEKEIHYLKSEISFPERIKTKNLFAFCALGMPHKFYNSLNKEGLSVKEFKSFADHHAYKEKDLQDLRFKARTQNLTLVTTLKDFVKIPTEYKKSVELISLKVDLTKNFKQSLLKKIEK